MNWQEYQEAVARLYEQTAGFGLVSRNVFLPDKITGQRRQIDVLVEIEAKGHKLTILIDAKFRQEKLNVKDVEEVLSLAQAVGASKAVVVAANGWTHPSEVKARASDLDLRLLTLDEALDIMVPEKWEICPRCEIDCIVNDHGGMFRLDDGMFFWWFGGQCRSCKLTAIWCQDCGQIHYFEVGDTVKCWCGHKWICNTKGMRLKLSGMNKFIPI
jgi:hypothetical protein